MYWVSEALPPAVTALLASVLAIVLAVAPAPRWARFMLPVSTPPNAIVYGSGLVPLPEMVRSGIILDGGGAVLIWIALRLLCPLVGVM